MHTHSEQTPSSKLSNSPKLWLGAAAAAFVFACSPASASVNLVSNGSFETGDFNGWYHAYPQTQPWPGVVISDPGATASEPTTGNSPDLPGSYLADFVGDHDNETIEQHVYLLPGNYLAGFSAYPFSYQNPAQETFTIYVGNTSVASIDSSNVTGNQWYLISGGVSIAAAGWYDVRCKYKSHPGIGRDMLIDLIYLIPN